MLMGSSFNSVNRKGIMEESTIFLEENSSEDPVASTT